MLFKFICSCGDGFSFKAKTKNLDNHEDGCVVQNFYNQDTKVLSPY